MHRFGIYNPLLEWKQGDPPCSPFIHIALGYHAVEGDHMLLSAQLMTNREIDEAIDSLQSDLEECRKSAKSDLKKLRANMRHRGNSTPESA